MRTIDELKQIHLKASMEVLEERFTLLTETSTDILVTKSVNEPKLKACMCDIQALMEDKLAKEHVTDEEKEIIKAHAKEWTNELIPTFQTEIMNKMSPNLKEKVIQSGGQL